MPREGLITRFVRLTLRRPRTALLAALALTVLAGLGVQQIKVRSNFSDLLPDDHPSVVQAKELDKIVGGASFVVVAVEARKDEKASSAADRFLTDLRARLEAAPGLGLRSIDDRPPADFLKRASLLYLSLADLDRLKERIKFRIDRAKLLKMKLLIDFDASDSGDSLDKDIEGLKGKYASYLNPAPRYQNKEGTLFASLLKPDWRTTDVNRTQALLETLHGIVNGLNPAGYDPSLNVRFTGPYVKQMTQKKILLKDAALVSSIAFVGSILYLVLHFRRKRAVFLIGVPLVMSQVWALGAAYLFFGSLNLFSSVSCAILLGLAADYGIHFYSEYQRHRRTGEGPEDALALSIGHLGRAFVAASSTTAAAFFSLAFSSFKAFRETGIIAGVGILLCGLAFVFVLPPLTLLMERRYPEKRDEPQEWTEERQRFSHRWMHWVFSAKNLVLSGLVLLLPLAAVALGHLRFDYNLNNILGRQDTKELDGRIDGIFNHSVNPEVALAANFEDAEKVAAKIRAVQKRNEAAPTGSTLRGALSLGDFVPENQEAKREKIADIRALFTPQVLKAMTEEDRKSYASLEPMLDPGPVTLESVPAQIKTKFQDREGSVGRIVFVFPNFEMTKADRFMRFVEEIREVRCPECSGPFYASGESTAFYEIVKMLFREGRYVIGFTLAMLLGALWLNFRSLGATLTVFGPLVVGLLATFGWMAATGIAFNIINMAAIPIILGTADDYGVHLFQRYLDHPEASLHESYGVTFRPILGSAITTLIGFGALGFADMGGIRSFGIVCVVGIGLCTLTTLVWFPALLALQKRRKARLSPRVPEAARAVSATKAT